MSHFSQFKHIFGWSLVFFLGTLNLCQANTPNRKNQAPIQHIILVHGAFVDGSGWEAVYHRLKKKGYNVTVSQHKLQGLYSDVAEVIRLIEQQDGPTLLVGHSYGGVVISVAGNHPKVRGLVYIAAHMPEANENRGELFKRFPPAYTSLVKTGDGLDYILTESFAADFAADFSTRKAAFMAKAQVPTADSCFTATIRNPAWKVKPVYYMVAAQDRIINPGLQRMYAERGDSRKIVEIRTGSHAIYASRPRAVYRLVDDAVKELQKANF